MYYFVTLLLVNHYIDYYAHILTMANENISINNLPDLLTVREVAQVLRVSPLTIKRWGKRGKLPAIRINSRGDRRYKKEAVLWLLGIQQKGTDM
jgi:excisionase family DNA binding protein